MKMLPLVVGFFGILGILTPCQRAKAANAFDVGGKPAEWAVVTTGDALLPDMTPTSPMLDQIRGLLVKVDKGHMLELRTAGAGMGAVVDLPASAHRYCVVHVGAGALGRDVEVLRDGEGVYFARDLGSAVQAKAAKFAPKKFAALAATWPQYRGGFTLPANAPKPGVVAELSKPCTPGWFTINQDLLGERFHGGQHTSLDAPQRDLDSETLLVRLPKGYDPKVACGVVVYVDPGDKASIYPPFHAVADELGLILVAAVHTGNDVHRAIRYQLALDGLATVSERYLVDPRRVYITGVSGGGQISTHLWLCFSDVFTGAIPIVALGSYENIPAGEGKIWPATFSKPVAKLFKLAEGHRCAAMTGGKDMNEKPVNGAVESLKRDGLKVKVYDYPDMGHTVPTAERFTEAVKWVDEPYMAVRQAEEKAAEAALAKVDASLTGTAREAALVEVTRVGPWTAAAWKAVEMMEKK